MDKTKPSKAKEATIRTTEQLRAAMAEVSGSAVADEALVWFVCVQNARDMAENTTKDTARMLQAGIRPADIADVQPWLDAQDPEDEQQADLRAEIRGWF